MRREKLDETAKLVGLESSQIIEPKMKKFLKRLIFPFIQIGILGINSILGFAFGKWENQDPSIYPWGVIPRAYYLAPIVLLGIGAGNTIISIRNQRRIALEKLQILIISLLTTVFSIISFYLIYFHIETVTESMIGVVPKYGVYNQEMK